MTKRRQVYVCDKCGNTVEVIGAGPGTLTCCNQPMTLAQENTTDAAQEKHVPVVERRPGEVGVNVGSVGHPMAEDHFIEWIEIEHNGTSVRRFLEAGREPTATFACLGGEVTARAYCNLHGLWMSQG